MEMYAIIADLISIDQFKTRQTYFQKAKASGANRIYSFKQPKAFWRLFEAFFVLFVCFFFK